MVAGVRHDTSACHRFCHLGSRPPNWLLNVLLEPYIVDFALFAILVFARALVATDRLVVACVCQVSILPHTVFGNEPLRLRLVLELQRGAIGISLMNEGSPLLDILCKWLVSV